jgi:release factor glutamine methyltransferase
MKINAFLAQATETLQQAGISTARLDVLVLLEDILNTKRTQILAEPDYRLTEEEYNQLSELLHKRAQHIPLAYLRGKTEFYGREFIVNEHVLEPRPESETMIDMLKKLKLPEATTLCDVGSGSGALGITAALELPQLSVTLLEIDADALAVSVANSSLHNVSVRTLHNDLLDGISEHFDVLLCNLPYVPTDFQINTAASHEPALAIFGGEDGLDVYRHLFAQLRETHSKPAYVFTESLPPQHADLAAIARKAGYRNTVENDFIQLFEAI